MLTLRLLPEGAAAAPASEEIAHLEHGGVGGDDVEVAAFRRLAEGAAQGEGRIGLDVRGGVEAGVLEAEGHVPGARTRDGERAGLAGEQLEIDVPGPGEIAAVGDVVVEEQGNILRLPVGGGGAEDLVEAGRVLGEDDVDAAAGDREPLLAAGGDGERSEPLLH